MTRSQAESMIVKSRKDDVDSKRVTVIFQFIGETEEFIFTGRLVPKIYNNLDSNSGHHCRVSARRRRYGH